VHARVQQFGSRAYGPLFTAGMHFWQLGESHYWGHNAILRVAPFIEHCALAPLPGQTSLSGDVMSHDFVEAALMRRAGWKVWIAYDLDGSYEQVPPNLLAELQRDRRWCHGNLQNSRLMFEPDLHPVHRTVFLTGVLAYASAPLWLAFLLVSTLLFATQAHDVPKYFVEPFQLFPIWPTANLKLMLTLFGMTAVLLLAPKVLSLLIILLRGEARPVRRRVPALARRRARVHAFDAARTGPHAVPHPVRAGSADRLEAGLEIAAARRRRHAVARSGAPARRAFAARARVGRGNRLDQQGVPVVAVAGDHRHPCGDPALGARQPLGAGPLDAQARHLPDFRKNCASPMCSARRGVLPQRLPTRFVLSTRWWTRTRIALWPMRPRVEPWRRATRRRRVHC
jgi:hypothetical protein